MEKQNEETIKEWIDVKEKKPEKFDLVYMLFDNERVQPGWWTGTIWDCGKTMKGDKVIAWKIANAHYL